MSLNHLIKPPSNDPADSASLQQRKWQQIIGVAAICVLALVPAIAGADDTTDQERAMTSPGETGALSNQPIDSMMSVQLAGLTGQRISLDEARKLALENSTTILSAQALVDQARGSTRRERGSFDPIFFAELIRSRNNSPTSSPFAGAEALDEKSTDLKTGIDWKLRFGTQLELSLNSNGLETNSDFTALNPQYTALGRLDVTQPLLAGSWKAASAPVTAAERVEDAAEARYRDAVLALIETVDETYWDLYAAERDLAAIRISLDQAETFLSETRARGEAGLIGPGDVANATVFYSQQQQAELDGQETLDRVSNRLFALIGYEVTGSQQRLRTTDSPEHRMNELESIDSLTSEALATNYAVKAAELELEASKALTRGAAWDILPQLDLIGSIGGNGLAGTARDVVFGNDTLSTTFGGPASDAFDQALKRDYPTWSVGLRISIPIGMRSTRGERDRLKASEAVAEQNVVAMRRSVKEQVRNAVLEYNNSERRLIAAERGVSAARELVRIGDINFRVGLITAFEVVRLNADLASAQLRHSQALVRAAKATAALRRLTGDITEVATISW